jgi:protease YdgD
MITRVLRILAILMTIGQPLGATYAEDFEKNQVGRVIVGGRDVCSGTLVAPSIVLTAGHCLQPKGSNKPVSVNKVKFLIKSNLDGRRRLFSAIDTGISPQFFYRNAINPSLDSLQGDMALIKLDGIATRSGFEVLGDPARSGGIGYITARLREDRSPEGLETCLVKVMANDILALSCYREEGFSGSPVFAMIDGVRRVIGVVTARSDRRGALVLYASIPHLRIKDIIWSNMRGDDQIQVIGNSSQRKK